MQWLARNDVPSIVDWVPHHTIDQHSWRVEHPEYYDHYTLPDGTRAIGNFFNLGWLPRLAHHKPGVFEATQRYLLDLAHPYGSFIRTDHPDGLNDPVAVQEKIAALGHYAWWEKICQDGEDLPNAPNLLGETGYVPGDFLNRLCHNGRGVELLTASWQRQTGDYRPHAEADRQNRVQAALAFHNHLSRAQAALGREDVTIEELADWAASFPVYRTYLRRGETISAQDAGVLDRTALPAWLKDGLKAGDFVDFIEIFQPITSAIFAKGREDTTDYERTEVPSLNEVGGQRSPISPLEFCAKMSSWFGRYPLTMVDTETHDSKRSLAMRANGAYSTHMPEAYIAAVDQLMVLSAVHDRQGVITPRAKRFIFDTMLTCWPMSVSRLNQYFRKSFRESKVESNWCPPNTDWEKKMFRFVIAISSDRAILAVLEPMAAQLAVGGRELLLSQTLMKIFMGGTAIFYHGTPWTPRLVDPDNRRYVDYGALASLLREVKSGASTTSENALTKLIYKALTAKKEHIPDIPTEAQTEYGYDAATGLISLRRGKLVAVVAVDGKSVATWSNGRNLLEGFRGQALYVE
jgi:(1->4)-alpha-D-glucan 1-alpha-D-glucosylmutase